MFGSPRNSIAAYAQVSLESDIRSADPHRLIVLLFEGAESGIAVAKRAIENHDIPAKHKAITQVTDIIMHGLLGSLDLEKGGDLAEKLEALYQYMCSRLLYANLKNSIPALDEVNGLLKEIHSAWTEIDPKRQAQPVSAAG
jgi:flagellar protein FliS